MELILTILTFIALFIVFAMFIPGSVRAENSPPDPDRGLYAIWFGRNSRALDLPFIRGGQVMVQWADLETAEGVYDFSALDGKLRKYHEMGRKATVQVNGNVKPGWLFSKVAVLPNHDSPQVKDKEGALQYWDPIFKDAYRNFILAYGEHLRTSPYMDACLGVRLNFNSIGTEHSWLKKEEQVLDRWKPAPNGHIHKEPWSREVLGSYFQMVIRTFIQAFHPDIRIFVRNNVFGQGTMEPEQIRMFEQGELALFHTSSEVQPRSRGVQRQYEAFLKYCKPGDTIGYAESWADARGRHGGKTDPRPFSEPQWNYWRLLIDLNCGISFIAIYGSDLDRVDEPEFRQAFEFAAKYAGYHASPEQSPGAWVALRGGDYLEGDYTFLMSRVGMGDKSIPLSHAGPGEQRFGAWARAIENGAKMRFRLNPEFAASLLGKPCQIRIVYLDDDENSFTVSWGKGGELQKQSVRKQGTDRWQETIIYLPSAQFNGDMEISGQGRNVFHILEVLRSKAR